MRVDAADHLHIVGRRDSVHHSASHPAGASGHSNIDHEDLLLFAMKFGES